MWDGVRRNLGGAFSLLLDVLGLIGGRFGSLIGDGSDCLEGGDGDAMGRVGYEMALPFSFVVGLCVIESSFEALGVEDSKTSFNQVLIPLLFS